MAPVILCTALNGGELSTSCPGHFTSWERTAWYPLNRRLCRSQCQTVPGLGNKEGVAGPQTSCRNVIVVAFAV
jgi:hypothetical protein